MPDITDQDLLVCESCGKTSNETRIFTLQIAGANPRSVKWCEPCMELNGFTKNPIA